LLVPLGAPSDRRPPRLLLVQCGRPHPARALEGCEPAERASHGVRLDQLLRGVQRRPVRAPRGIRRHPRPPHHLMSPDRYESHVPDVLVIGAGGAGLRAAIDAAAQGCSVGLVCKSLLGKAHTVMAEGGIAAALANTDPRDSWKVHFRDTMRGGKLLN